LSIAVLAGAKSSVCPNTERGIIDVKRKTEVEEIMPRLIGLNLKRWFILLTPQDEYTKKGEVQQHSVTSYKSIESD
jgi:hypothetical protein